MQQALLAKAHRRLGQAMHLHLGTGARLRLHLEGEGVLHLGSLRQVESGPSPPKAPQSGLD